MKEALYSALSRLPSFSQLNQTDELNATIVNLIIKTILALKEQTTAPEFEQLQTLIIALLQEPYEFSETQLSSLIQKLENKHLIDLILTVDSYPGIHQQALNCFCQRLRTASGLPNDPIHQWQAHPKAPQLALLIVSNPEQLLLLASRSNLTQQFAQNYLPTCMQAYVIKSAADDIQHRAIAVLEKLDCNDLQLNAIALNTLNYYRETPLLLHTLFTNLDLADADLKKSIPPTHQNFQINYHLFKKACWHLLNSHDLPYEEAKATQLLTQGLTTAHCFDRLLITLINQKALKEGLSALQNDTYATYLNLLDESKLNLLQPVTLASLLTASTEKTKANWEKIVPFLKTGAFNPETRLAFLKACIQQSIKKNQAVAAENALNEMEWTLIDSNNYAWAFITSTPDFLGFLTYFDADELYWLVTNSPPDYLATHFSDWLDILLQANQFTSHHVTALLVLLPQDEDFLKNLLAKDSLIPYLPTLFLYFVSKKEYTPYLLALFSEMTSLNASKQTEQQKQASLRSFQEVSIAEFETVKSNEFVPVILTTLLLTLTTLKRSDKTAKELIDSQLKLFKLFVTEKPNDRLAGALGQAVFNLLQFLCHEDNAWIKYFFEHEDFAVIAPCGLKTINEEHRNKHLYTTLLLENTTARIHPALQSASSHQGYIRGLLTPPFIALRRDPTHFDERFKNLFNQLTTRNKETLARQILQDSLIGELTELARITVTHALESEQLYQLFLESHSPAIFVTMFAQSKYSFNNLSAEQKQKLFASLDKTQLVDILTSSSSKELKFRFVEYLFEYLQQQVSNVAEWLRLLNFEGTSLLILANYTLNPIFHSLIMNALTQAERLRVLRQESLDALKNLPEITAIHSESLLYSLIEGALLHPEGIWECNPNFFLLIDNPVTIQDLIKNQYAFIAEVNYYQDLRKEHEQTELFENITKWNTKIPLLLKKLFPSMPPSFKMNELSNTERDSIPECLNKLTAIDSQHAWASLIEQLSKRPKAILKACFQEKAFRNWFFNRVSLTSLSQKISEETLKIVFAYYPIKELVNSLNDYKAKYVVSPAESEQNKNDLARYITLTKAVFFYQNDENALLRLSELKHCTNIKTNPNLLVPCLESYSSIFESENHPVIPTYLSEIAELPESILAAINSSLLKHIMNCALHTPEAYESLIYKLITTDSRKNYHSLIQTQLTALIRPYKLEQHSKNSYTLDDLTPNEISNISAKILQNILFLQRLFFHLTPEPTLQNWVNTANEHSTIPLEKQHTRAYFLADAQLYETLVSMPVTLDENAPDQRKKDYQNNLDTICNFLTGENKSNIYGGLFEQLQDERVGISPEIAYHAFNLFSFLTDDDTLTTNELQGFAKLLNRTVLPIPTLLQQLYKNCHPLQKTRSILLVHLLGREDFISQLPSTSMLCGLNNTTGCVKKRLQPYVETIKLNLLPKELIRSLTPEAAATIFCSVPHFHQFNEENLPLLFTRLGQSCDRVISYWIKAYSSMPNYELALLKIAALDPEKIRELIKELPIKERLTVLLSLFHKSGQVSPISEQEFTALNILIDDTLNDIQTQNHPQDLAKLIQLADQLSTNTGKSAHQKKIISNFWTNLTESRGRIIAYSLKGTPEKFKKFMTKIVQNKPLGEVIKLLSAALPYLNNEEDTATRKMVNRAQDEAILELGISQLSFLKGFRSRWRRYFFYKRTGEKALYITPAKTEAKKVLPEISTITKLSKLTAAITADSPREVLISFFMTLDAFEQETKDDDLLSIRTQVDQVLTKLTAASLTNTKPELTQWLNEPKHLAALLANRKQLIALYGQLNQTKTLRELLASSKEQGYTEFETIKNELFCQAPPNFELQTPVKTNFVSTCMTKMATVAGQLKEHLSNYRGLRLWKTKNPVSAEPISAETTTEQIPSMASTAF